MRFHTMCFLGLVLVLGSGSAARADVPPLDACTAPGQPCNNAGPAFNQTGVCTASNCSRTVPGPDGGTMVMTYTCNLCKASGTGGNGGAGTGGAGTEGAGTGGGGVGTGGGSGGAGTGGSGGTDGGVSDAATKPPSGGGSGCSITGLPQRGSAGGLLALFGLLVFLGTSRRRRS